MNEVIVGSGSVDLAISMATTNDDLEEMISIRISAADLAEVKRLAKAFDLKPMTIARIALRSGLDSMDRDPGGTLRRAAKQRTERSQSRKAPKAQQKRRGRR